MCLAYTRTVCWPRGTFSSRTLYMHASRAAGAAHESDLNGALCIHQSTFLFHFLNIFCSLVLHRIRRVLPAPKTFCTDERSMTILLFSYLHACDGDIIAYLSLNSQCMKAPPRHSCIPIRFRAKDVGRMMRLTKSPYMAAVFTRAGRGEWLVSRGFKFTSGLNYPTGVYIPSSSYFDGGIAVLSIYLLYPPRE